MAHRLHDHLLAHAGARELVAVSVAQLVEDAAREARLGGDVKPERPVGEALAAAIPEYELDSIKVSMLKLFIEDCSKKNIKLYFVSTPYYMKTIGTDYSLAITKQIATATHTPFFDYSQDSMYMNKPQFFDDTVHLNYNGSKIFCEALAAKLKKEINSVP